ALASEGVMGKAKASKQGMAGLELQRRLPKARVVYTSATSASKLEAFCYAPRLGLWGNGKAFATRDAFINALSAGGTAAMELLCRDAKALGVYLATSLSLEGVTYERLEHRLTADQEEVYNAIAEAWRAIYLNAEAALDVGEGGSDARRAARGQLELARVRTLQAVMTSLKMPTVIEHMQRSLAAGKSIVVQLTNTYEASMKRSLEKQSDQEADLELLDLSPKDIVVDYLLRAFPTQQYRTVVGPDNVERSVPITDEHDVPLANPEAVARRDDLIAKVHGLLCPDGPMEILIDHFGSEHVAEVTGRRKRVVRKLVNGEYQRVVEERAESANLGETVAFNAGKKRILIFSEAAGGTGRSYHASRTVSNQQQRYHYLLQTGWRSDRAIQGLGRTHRTNQAVTPHWLLCTLDVPGERRFISTIAKRVESLGACTRGQRDAAGTSLFSAGDSLENRYGTEAVTALLNAIAHGEIEDFDYHRWLDQTNLPLFKEDGSPAIAQISVSRFLNKVLACDVADQRTIMEILLEKLEAIIATAKAKGVYDTGIVTLKALAIERVEERTVYVEPTTNAQTHLVKLRLTVEAHTTGFGTALASVRKSKERYGKEAAGFREDDERGIFAWYQVASSLFEGAEQVTYATVTPRRRELGLSIPSGDDQNEDVAHGLWELALASSSETITYHEYVMTGTLLPIYDRLPNEQAKVYRIVLDTGTPLLGRVIPREQLATVVANLGIEQETGLTDVLDALADGHRIVLSDNSTLVRRVTGGSKRLEFVPYVTARYMVRERLVAIGFRHERANYVDRYAVPLEEEREVVPKVLAHWSVRAISK
ncbi:MAG: strawberry notch C-terminal domain-containing protein, partial [Candidatus Baltobacteraceae bacterium]